MRQLFVALAVAAIMLVVALLGSQQMIAMDRERTLLIVVPILWITSVACGGRSCWGSRRQQA